MLECKHGTILNLAECFSCKREKKAEQEKKQKRDEALKRILERAEKLDW